MSAGEIKVLLTDDHALVRDALADRLQKEPGITVVGTAATASEAVEKTLETVPDIILMDIDMPGLASFEAVRKIASLQPEVRVVFLSAFISDWYIEQALGVKAHGYLTKQESPDRVVAALREVANGGAAYSDEVRSRIVVDSRGVKLARPSQSRLSQLTAREVETLRYIARGMSKKEIAQTVHISVKTVDRHTVNLMQKLDIHDRVELTRFAIREGLVEV